MAVLDDGFEKISIKRVQENEEEEIKRRRKNLCARINRKLREDLMKSCGLKKGKDSMGKTIWE